LVSVSKFLQRESLPNAVFRNIQLVNKGKEWQLVGRNAGEEIARHVWVEIKVLWVEFKTVLPTFGLGRLGKPIFGDGLTEDFPCGEVIQVFVEECYGGVGIALCSL